MTRSIPEAGECLRPLNKDVGKCANSLFSFHEGSNLTTPNRELLELRAQEGGSGAAHAHNSNNCNMSKNCCERIAKAMKNKKDFNLNKLKDFMNEAKSSEIEKEKIKSLELA